MIAFSPLLQQTTLHDAVIFVVILPLLWASLRQGPRDTATITLIISAFVVWCTEMQCGPFAKPSPNDSFILSLAFMISTAVPFLALSTDVAVRYRIEDQERQHALETEVLWQTTDQVAFGGSFDDLLRGCRPAGPSDIFTFQTTSTTTTACLPSKCGTLSAKS